jgi:hypothetical protein
MRTYAQLLIDCLPVYSDIKFYIEQKNIPRNSVLLTALILLCVGLAKNAKPNPLSKEALLEMVKTYYEATP